MISQKGAFRITAPDRTEPALDISSNIKISKITNASSTSTTKFQLSTFTRTPSPLLSPLRACLFTRLEVIHKTTHLRDKLQPAPVLPDLAHLAHGAHRALVLGLVLATVEGAGLEGAAAVDGRVGGGADVELGELVELDFMRVVGAALT